MIGVIEWKNDGKRTKTYSPYIQLTDKKPFMLAENGRPLIFYSEASALDYASEWMLKNKSKPKN